MKLRSRGLGRRELLMDFREYDIARDGDDIVVSGTIREPVNWDFTIRISGDDIPGMLRVGLHRHTLSLAARWVLHIHSKAPAVPTAAGAATAPVPIIKPARPRRPLPVEREKALAPEPASITHLRPPAADSAPVSQVMPVSRVTPVSPGTPAAPGFRTPDFGAPRRRGSARMTAAPETGAVAEGRGR